VTLPTAAYPGATFDGNEQSVANDPGSPDPTIAEGLDHNKLAAELVAIETDLRDAFASESAASVLGALQALRASIDAQATHAGQHKHGGSDEVAQSAPGANAIPKAGAGSTLSTGWLPQATESAKGALEIPTLTETSAGTDDTKAVTPKKLIDWHDGLAEVFGQDAQRSVSPGRSTTTSTTFQTKTSITTPALTGIYRVTWSCYIDQSTTVNQVTARCRNQADVVDEGGVAIFQPRATAERTFAGGIGYIVFTGAAKTFDLQYAVIGSGTAGIQNAAIEFWRIS
jgi:hypothetical protein